MISMSFRGNGANYIWGLFARQCDVMSADQSRLKRRKTASAASNYTGRHGFEAKDRGHVVQRQHPFLVPSTSRSFLSIFLPSSCR